jgi:phosphocarrier protein
MKLLLLYFIQYYTNPGSNFGWILAPVFDIVLLMITKYAVVNNRNGIHVRPSQAIASSVAGYSGSIQIEAKAGKILDANTISIISLGLMHGDRLSITVEGPDEKNTCEHLVNMFETEYDFPPRGE